MRGKKSRGYGVSLLAILLAILGCDGLQVGVVPSTHQPNRSPVGDQSQLTPTKTMNSMKANRPPVAASTATATSTLTPTAFADPVIEENSASIIVRTAVLRSGPGTLFSPLGSYVQGADLMVYGVTPNRQWAKVRGPDQQPGWVSVDITNIKPDALPVITPTEGVDAYPIYGRIIDTDGVPVDGINIAVTAQNNSEQRTDAYSNDTGAFAVYIPLDLTDVAWSVHIVGVMCTSRIMRAQGSTCQFNNYIELAPHVLEVTQLPLSSELLFRYEVVHSAIAGKVLDAGGGPVKDMRVYAEREDGAYSYGETNGLGEFSLPASNGSWMVYTVTYDPYREGKRAAVTIQNDKPDRIDLQPPE